MIKTRVYFYKADVEVQLSHRSSFVSQGEQKAGMRCKVNEVESTDISSLSLSLFFLCPFYQIRAERTRAKKSCVWNHRLKEGRS